MTFLIMSRKLHPPPESTSRERHPSLNSDTGSQNSKPRSKPSKFDARVASYILPRSGTRTTERPARVRSVPPAKSISTGDTTPTVRDGKQFHVRVTLGYLKALTKTEKKKGGVTENQPLVTTAFASLDPTSAFGSDHVFAPSLPLDLASEATNAVWPRTRRSTDNDVIAANKSNRRLYFSTFLEKDDLPQTEHNRPLEAEDDVSTATSVWNPQQGETYSPELVKIQLGLARGEDLLYLGVATLVVNGQNISKKQMDLPVRALLSGEDVNIAPKSHRLKGLFGKKSRTLQNVFTNDGYDYSITPNAILRIRLDVSSEVTNLSGPVLWGDMDDDDNDSFGGSFAGAQISEEATNLDLSIDEYGSIEVVNNASGTTIISAPVFKNVELGNDLVSSQDRTAFPIRSIIATKEQVSPRHIPDEYNEPSILQSAMMCGTLHDVDPSIDASQSVDFDDSSTIATSRYKGTRGEKWKTATKPKAEMLYLKKISEGSMDESMEGISSNPTTTSYSHYTDYASIGNDTVESLTAAKRVLQKYANRAGVNLEELLEDLDGGSYASSEAEESIGEDTLDSVFQAKALLQNYAKRIGVDVEDILKADVVRRDTKSLAESMSPSSLFGSLSETASTDVTQGTKTTKSRFSLFL